MAVSAILLIESTVIHLWVSATHPVLAWILTVSSVLTLVWFWRDDARYRAGSVLVSESHITLALGARWCGDIPRVRVQSAMRPSWKDLPEAGGAESRDYVNVTKPADVNVLLQLHDDTPLRAFGMVTKNVRRIGIHLDAPDEFFALLRAGT